MLWIKSPGVIGTHKHRGPVWAIGLEGSFRYLEYDWVCRPGDFITETPGTAHTLVTDDPDGMKALFWMQGANEFYDADGNHVETLDVWWFMVAGMEAEIFRPDEEVRRLARRAVELGIHALH